MPHHAVQRIGIARPHAVADLLQLLHEPFGHAAVAVDGELQVVDDPLVVLVLVELLLLPVLERLDVAHDLAGILPLRTAAQLGDLVQGLLRRRAIGQHLEHQVVEFAVKRRCRVLTLLDVRREFLDP